MSSIQNWVHKLEIQKSSYFARGQRNRKKQQQIQQSIWLNFDFFYPFSLLFILIAFELIIFINRLPLFNGSSKIVDMR